MTIETMLFIFLLIIFSFIGVCATCNEREEKWSIAGKLIFVAVYLGILALICLFGRYGYFNRIEQPDAPGDTQVDKFLDEIRNDDKTIYFDDEIQILVYKYMLKYTREGKYEMVDEKTQKLIDKSNAEIIKSWKEE